LTTGTTFLSAVSDGIFSSVVNKGTTFESSFSWKLTTEKGAFGLVISVEEIIK
jgi:hypothetical protein